MYGLLPDKRCQLKPECGMRASRLLSILILLQLRTRLTADALAAEFGVSVRTIYRDVDELSAAGVPVFGDRKSVV